MGDTVLAEKAGKIVLLNYIYFITDIQRGIKEMTEKKKGHDDPVACKKTQNIMAPFNDMMKQIVQYLKVATDRGEDISGCLKILQFDEGKVEFTAQIPEGSFHFLMEKQPWIIVEKKDKNP